VDNASWLNLTRFAGDPEWDDNHHPSDPYAKRLVQAVRQNSGKGDIAGLLRACLRSRAGHIGSQAKLQCNAQWVPDERTLGAHGLVREERGGDILVSAGAWVPTWLDGAPEARVYRSEPIRRMERPVRSDPVARQVSGFNHYRSSGQATAVRYVANAEPGSTTLVNLPTGSGKSLAFQVPFAIASRRNRVSVLVVPTTALALDQEQRLGGIDGVTARAYHSGLSTEERKSFRRGFETGSIHVLVTSPESFLSALAPSLHIVAVKGLLAWVALDEAHMAASWGNDFRPEFQVLGGFIHQLREAAPSNTSRVSTLLLSATVSSPARRRLRELLVHSQRFRPYRSGPSRNTGWPPVSRRK
jgi:ATP-dependent DNA helicase RecQ